MIAQVRRCIVNNMGIFLFLFLNLFSFITPLVLNSSSFVVKTKKTKEQINYCNIGEFQCENKKCIPEKFICDGIPDCWDDSDETYDHCRSRNKTCNVENSFQCQYGACVNKEYECDGFVQCVDNSDENHDKCKEISNKRTRKARATQINSRSCAIPSSPTQDKAVTFHCGGNVPTQNCDTEHGYVAEFTVASVRCAPQYYQEKGVSDSDSVCHNKKWLPDIEKCFKICQKLNPVNVVLSCYRNGINIPCDENSKLLDGTKVRPSCKQWHTFAQPPNYLEITCNSDGTWDNPLFSCIPDCGRRFSNPTTLISHGVREQFGDSPWHVAIYNKDKNLICGGTIITPNLVVSAAHCFARQGVGDYSTDIFKDYEVVVSKATRNYSVKDNDNQKAIKIKEIRFSKKGFFGLSDNFSGDVVVLILKETLSISSTVLPACVDWMGLKDGKYPQEDEHGKVVGWGMDQNGKYNEALMTANLPFISRERCIKIVPYDFKPFVTFDKFCAGSEDGPSVLQGDSGGGLLFKQNDVYYLRGVVSLKQPTKSAYAVFTDLSEHIQWISDVRYEVENEITKMVNLMREIRYEMQTKARDDPLKLLQLAERIKNEIINRETILDDLKNQARSLLDKVTNSTQITMAKIISDALLASAGNGGTDTGVPGLSAVHQFGYYILTEKRDYKMYFDIFRKAVDNVLDKIAVEELIASIRREDLESCCTEEIVTIYTIVFERIKRSGEINADAGIKLAERFKETVQTRKYQTLDFHIRSKFDQIKNQFPESVKNTIGPITSKLCTTKNKAGDQYLIVFETMSNNMATTKSSTWILEPDGDQYVYLKHKQTEQYMFANFQEKYNNTKRTALTFKLAAQKTFDTKWKIIDCPVGLSITH